MGRWKEIQSKAVPEFSMMKTMNGINIHNVFVVDVSSRGVKNGNTEY